jgi:hypothetical protein
VVPGPHPGVVDDLVLADPAGDVEHPTCRASSTTWNRSRSPVTTSTGIGAVAAKVPITSSAS